MAFALAGCSASSGGGDSPMTATPDGDGAPGSAADSGASGADGGSGADSATGNGGIDASSASGGGDGAAPAGFWDTSNIPAAKNVMTFKFLNRTNGKYADSEVYWSFKNGSISETHSIADQPTYDMPANASGRMYFYLCGASDATCASDPTKSKYLSLIHI